MSDIKTNGTGDKIDIAIIKSNLEHITGDISEINETIKDIRKNFVTKHEFVPVRNVVYGMVGLILASILTAVTYLIINPSI